MLSFLITSCGALLHKTYTIQSDKQLLKTEVKNFNGDKAQTQWWYFDFFLDDTFIIYFFISGLFNIHKHDKSCVNGAVPC